MGLRPVCWLSCLCLVITIEVCFAQALPGATLRETVKELSDLLAHVQSPAARQYVYSKYAVEISGDIGKDAALELANKLANDGRVKTFAGHLEHMLEVSEEAKLVIESFNDNLPDLPDYSHLANYCEQVSASRDKLARIEESTADLKKIRDLAKSYQRVLPSLKAMSRVMRDYWYKVGALGQFYDAAIENTSVGTMTGQWMYWTFGHDDCTAGDPCAGYLISAAEDNWAEVTKLAELKIANLRKAAERFQAFHYQFYSTAEKKCEGEKKEEEALDQFLADVEQGSMLDTVSASNGNSLARANERIATAEASTVQTAVPVDSSGIGARVANVSGEAMNELCPEGSAKIQAIVDASNRKFAAMEGVCAPSKLLESMYQQAIDVYQKCPPSPQMAAVIREARMLRDNATEQVRAFCTDRN
jgi:hypothetical protein